MAVHTFFENYPTRQEVTISVDLVEAMNRQGQRVLAQPGDTLILRDKAREEWLNFGLVGFFTLGILSTGSLTNEDPVEY